jgi:hypothetical protein
VEESQEGGGAAARSLRARVTREERGGGRWREGFRSVGFEAEEGGQGIAHDVWDVTGQGLLLHHGLYALQLARAAAVLRRVA